MRQLTFCLALLACTAVPSTAQTRGWLSVGGSVTANVTTDADVGTAVTAGPLVRLTPRPGWRPSGALNWFEADLEGNVAGAEGEVGGLRTRPLMGGVSYTIGAGRALTTFSLVAGPSFNRARVSDELRRRAGALGLPVALDVDTSFAVRPGASVTWTLAPRVALVGFGGYILNRPDTTLRLGAAEVRDRWKADAVVLSVGAVYSLF